MEVQEGLEGVIAFASELSSIVGATLTYRGYVIEDLAEHSTFEEVVYLLWHGRLPRQAELDQLTHDLRSQYALPEPVLDVMHRLPTDVHPMEYVRTVTSVMALYDPDRHDNSQDANVRKATRMVARMPALVAGFDRIRNGMEPLAPKPDANIATNFLYMLQGQDPDPEFAKFFDIALILHADHEINASTFAARATVSTVSDIYSGVVSAIGSLKGPLHGGANEQVMVTLKAIGSIDNVEPYLMKALANRDRIMGFGHRVYKEGDPRAKILGPMSKRMGEKTGQPQWYEMSVLVDQIMDREKGLIPNVDFYSASTYHNMGIPTDIFTPVFVMSRVAGWTAHVIEQLDRNRLIRPRAKYVGPVDLKWVPASQR